MENKKGLLIVLSGPSGVGKDTLIREYLKDNDGKISISATTRNPRENEVNGVDYYFLTEEEFKDGIEKGDFLEYAMYNNNYYGTPKSKIMEDLDKGIDVILIIEVQGALQIKEMINDAVLIFTMPPSIETLRERIEKRNLDSPEMIENRLKIAVTEMELANKYDYVIVNNDLKLAKEKIELIINEEKEKKC